MTVHRGIPVTTPGRTLRDLKPKLPRGQWQSLLQGAEDEGLDLSGFTVAERPEGTKLERRMLAICRRHGIPKPRTQQIIGPYTVDFLWPAARLVVETDGYDTHGKRAAFEADRARDAWLTAQGYRVVRFTWRQLRDDPATVVATLRRLLGIDG